MSLVGRCGCPIVGMCRLMPLCDEKEKSCKIKRRERKKTWTDGESIVLHSRPIPIAFSRLWLVFSFDGVG